MKDVSEEAFCDFLERRLIEEYGEANVDREPHLPSGRIPDFVVRRWPVPFVVEAEDRAEDCIEGVGQAALYAAETDAHPVVLYPAETGEDAMGPELQCLNSVMAVRSVAYAPADGT